MRFMNRWEVEEAVARYLGHPVLGPATETLRNLMLWTDRNSDGWAYWPKPTRAAERLMELIQPDGQDWRYDEDRTDATELAYRKALRAIKTFRTRQNADFEIVEVRRETRETCEVCGQPDNCGDCDHTAAIRLEIEVLVPAGTDPTKVAEALNAALDEPPCDWGVWQVGAVVVVPGVTA